MAERKPGEIQRKLEDHVMKLPSLVNNINKSRSEAVQMRGINFSDVLNDGDMALSRNVSARRYPYITTRNAREKQAGYSGATAMTSWNKLVVVQGTDLLYDGSVVGTVTAGEKQFAVVNTKLVIWPDEKYLDLNTLTLKPLAASMSVSGATFTENSMTVSGVDLTQSFSAGDTVQISGCAETRNNKYITIQQLTATVMTVSENGFVDATETGSIGIARNIPSLDFICESENRLWGCSSTDQTIYASALGDPTNFYTYEGLSTDSYALGVGTEGNFTGCCKLSSSVLFWKEASLHKLLGSYPAEYSMYTYTLEGLQAGCHKSLQVINEVLYYMGLHGVYAFSGGTPTLISGNFGNRTFTDAIAGNDGDSYFLSVMDGEVPYLFVYETAHGLWVMEENLKALDFTRQGRDLYFIDADGDVWLEDSGEPDADIEWTVRFTPFYETIQGRKVYSKLLFRVQLPKKSYMTVKVRTDSKPWTQVDRRAGEENDVISMRIPINRCDKFEIELAGKGPCTLLSFLREFSIGSDV